jgi:hypothetical protein
MQAKQSGMVMVLPIPCSFGVVTAPRMAISRTCLSTEPLEAWQVDLLLGQLLASGLGMAANVGSPGVAAVAQDEGSLAPTPHVIIIFAVDAFFLSLPGLPRNGGFGGDGATHFGEHLHLECLAGHAAVMHEHQTARSR